MITTYLRLRETGLRLVRIVTDEKGVVSFEYVIVAACIVGAVSLAFGTDASSGIGKALSDAVAAISSKLSAAV
jgi:Flp pilus assembly pilin Flp